MGKVAVFVDAGYFWVQAGLVVHGVKSARDSVSIDYSSLRQEVLEQAAAQFPNADLLRVYWYDGPGGHGTKTSTHHSVDELDDFKLRLGTRNGYGDQKAVDGLIIADLIGLAQSKAISGAIVLSGDADLTPGVIAAQGLGIRVHLLSMGPANATSPFLRSEVDHKAHWADPTVQKFASALAPRPVAAGNQAVAPIAPAANNGGNELGEVATKIFQEFTVDGQPIALENGRLPRQIDGKLLFSGGRKLGRDLTPPEKREIRKSLLDLIAGKPGGNPC